MKQIEQQKQDVLAIFRVREVLTALVLIVSLLVTYNMWRSASLMAEQTLQTTFDFRVRKSNERIRQRLHVYEQVLSATAGLFAAKGKVSREEFHRFVDALSLAARYPGVQGVGFVEAIRPQDRERHIQSVRAQGFPGYDIKPRGERDFYTSIVYLEPFAGANLRAFGYDMYSEPVRRAAMKQARDWARPVASGKVVLIQDSGQDTQSGFLIYLPVYRFDAPHETIAERRANLVGWVYAPFRMEDFMRGLAEPQINDLDIEIYDDNEISKKGLMFDSQKDFDAKSGRSGLTIIEKVEAAERVWTVVTSALDDFEQHTNTDRPHLILQAGIAISLLLTLLTWLFLDDRARALQAAQQAMQLALYDPLTGLPNRKLLDERLNQALLKAKRDQGHVALLFIDLDKFKPVNDNFGHAYGDLLLKEVASRLQSCMRESDTASRLGGDEFVALLTDIEGRHGVMVAAIKVLERLNAPYEIAGQIFDISASIGAALYPEHGTDSKSLTRSADMAMYAAKNAGRANVQFADAAGAQQAQH